LGENGTSAGRLFPRGTGMRSRIAAAIGLLSVAALLGACGSGGDRQDVTEPSGDYQVAVTKAKFPPRQGLSETSDLELEIRNTDDQPLPDLAVTIYTTSPTSEVKADGSFDIRVDDPALSNPNRPVWILEDQYPKLLTPGLEPKDLDKAPTAGAVAAQTDTFQFGELAPGESKDIDWRVTAVRGGTYTVQYQVAAGLQGKAHAVTSDGSHVTGEFVVTISTKPPKTCVNDAGQVVEGRCQVGK
jgi:hypothetical protein